MRVVFDVWLCLGQFLLLVIIFTSVLIASEIRWRYGYKITLLKCRLWGHDYHNGSAQNLRLNLNGTAVEYDFCQRCMCQIGEYRPIGRQKSPKTEEID